VFDQSAAQHQGPMDGRRRLHGAFAIDIERIEPDPNQPRKHIDPIHIEELTQSIRRHGVFQPISVRYVEHTGRYRIVAGECRYTAARQAGLTELPCWVKTPNENDVLIEQIVENWMRNDLNPFDLADSLAILRDANGYSQKRLAQETGKSAGEISKLLSILNMDSSVQNLARNDQTGRLSKRHLYALSRVPVPMQSRVVHRIQRDNLTAIDVERIAERLARAAESKDTRGPRYCRRSFRTTKAKVTLSFRSKTISDEDVLHAIHEVERQLAEQRNSFD